MDRLSEREAELAEIREQFEHLERRVAAVIDQAPATTTASALMRHRQEGPIHLQSEDRETLSEEEWAEIPEPPKTSRARPRNQSPAPIVRSQSPVVQAGGYDGDELRSSKSSVARRGSATAAQIPSRAPQPRRLGGHTPISPGSFGR
jgi:hypothetical protein